jgi:surfeit locus 1 family protein
MVLHLLVLAAVIVMVNLGLWQLRRLEGRRAANEVIAARLAEPPAALENVVPVGTSEDAARDAIFRRVTAVGTYQSDDEVLVRNRSLNGSAGYWVITPLLLADGTAVAVNRGWIPVTLAESADRSVYAAPGGTVAVEGLVRETEHRAGLGVADPESGKLDTLSRVDVPRLDAQTSYDLAPVWLQLEVQDPGQASGVPAVVPVPELDEGPHLNYAGQWFIYATLTVIVYPLLVRKIARNRQQPTDHFGPTVAEAPGTTQLQVSAASNAPTALEALGVEEGARQ